MKKRESFKFGQGLEIVVWSGPGSLYSVALYQYGQGLGFQYIRQDQYDRLKADYEALKGEQDGKSFGYES